jgi:isoleucyl-tRNA synthetase
MWQEEESLDKKYAYETIYYCLRMICRLLAPYAPHIAEEIYGNLRLPADPVSVHMLSWFEGDTRIIDTDLETRMDLIRSFDEAVANARQAGKRKLRWPVGTVTVVAGSDIVERAFRSMADLAKDRANAREITIIRGTWDRIGWRAEPVMKKVGPGFGKNGPKVKGLIEAADGTALRAELERSGTAALGENGEFVISLEHVIFHQHMPENLFSAGMSDAIVYVDVTLTPDLEAEGYTRELIRRLQDMRKQLDLNMDEFIVVDAIIADEHLCSLLTEKWQNLLCQEVRVRDLQIHRSGDSRNGGRLLQLDRDWDIEGIPVTLGISVAGNQ